jgi:NOL1/NOP2/sun family putative RNA methylase
MKNRPELKELYVERISKILENEEDFNKYIEILNHEPVKSIRCNKLKISPKDLKEKLETKYKWKISQPWADYPEVMIILSELLPGEIGRATEHLLGYYYMQELASMLPIIALNPKPHETILDLCASPGSKTTQICSEMNNTGLIIANEKSLGRIKILSSNLERCGVTNAIITRADGAKLCENLKKQKIKFDKILVDAPCSGEGTLRSTKATYHMWNINSVKQLSNIQKKLFENAFEILNPSGILIYSTCTHSPEENEEVINFALKKFEGRIKIEKINIPVKSRPGIQKWEEKEYLEEVKQACRIYPHDNNTEGFFLSKFTKLKD